MDSKKRLLMTLAHKIPDRVPWTLHVNSYFLRNQKGKYLPNDKIKFLKELNADIFYWNGFPAHCKDLTIKTFIDNKLYDTNKEGPWMMDSYLAVEYFKGDTERIVEKKYITSVGELNTKFKYTPLSQTVYITEFMIKTVNDYKIFNYMVENIEYLDFHEFYKEKNLEIKNKGIVGISLQSSPVYELISLFMGLENFHYLFNNHKKETIMLINNIFEKYIQCYQKYSNYEEINAVIIPEDASTTLYSPKFFDNYIKPFLMQYCHKIKEAGKIAVMHAYGHLKYLVDPIKEIGLDCIESVTPAPIGNIVLDEFKKLLPDVCMMGGIHANAWSMDNKAFKEYLKDLILKNKKDGNFILSSSDSLPSDAKIENIKSIEDLVKKYGKY